MRCPWVALPIVAMVLSAPMARPAQAGETRRTAIVQAIEKARDSVVNIHGQKLISSPDDDAGAELRRVNGMGTGVVIDPRGYIVTNYHVVEGVRRIEVTLASGRTTTATLISHDPRTDLAVIKIPVEGSLPVRGPHTGGYTVTGHDRLVGSFCQLPSRRDVCWLAVALLSISSRIFDSELSH